MNIAKFFIVALSVFNLELVQAADENKTVEPSQNSTSLTEESLGISNNEKLEPGVIHKGFRIGISLPRYKAAQRSGYTPEESFATEGGDYSINLDGKTDSQFAISAGWQNIRINKFGFMSTIVGTHFNNGSSESGAYKYLNLRSKEIHVRAEVNGTYGFNSKFYSLAGLNTGIYTQDELLSELNPTYGLQAGVGYKFSKKYDAEIKYISMRNEGFIGDTYPSFDSTLELSGFELGISALF